MANREPRQPCNTQLAYTEKDGSLDTGVGLFRGGPAGVKLCFFSGDLVWFGRLLLPHRALLSESSAASWSMWALSAGRKQK